MLNFAQKSNGLCVAQNKIKISQSQQQKSVLQHTCVLLDLLIHWLQRAICASFTLPKWEHSHKSPLVSMEDAPDSKMSEEQPNTTTLPLGYKLVITIITITISEMAMEHQILYP